MQKRKFYYLHNISIKNFYVFVCVKTKKSSRLLEKQDLVYSVSFPKMKRFFEFTQKRGKILHNNYNKNDI